VHTQTDGIYHKFSDAGQRESNYGRIIGAICYQKRNLFQSLSTLLSVQYIKSKSGTSSVNGLLVFIIGFANRGLW
jgi:hypothetical protein